jgi:hypothetical protein
MQEAVNERLPPLQNQLAMIGTALAIDPSA